MTETQSQAKNCNCQTRWIRGYKIVCLTLISLVGLIAIERRSNAEDLSRVVLQVYKAASRGVSITSNDGTNTRGKAGKKIQLRKDTLQTSPDNKSWAALQFLRDGAVKNYEGLLLKTIPSWGGTSYTFPCTAAGTFNATWRRIVKDASRTCDGGLKLLPPSELPTQAESGSRLQVGRKSLNKLELAQQFAASGQVTVIPGPEFVLLEVDTNALIDKKINDDTEIEVDVLTGTITVEDAIHPNGLEVEAGQRYNSASGQVTEINCLRVGQTDRVRAFLDVDFWVADQALPSVAQDIEEHLEQQQVALSECRKEEEEKIPSPDIDITLQWSTNDDLDLSLTGPNGEDVSYRANKPGNSLPPGVEAGSPVIENALGEEIALSDAISSGRANTWRDVSNILQLADIATGGDVRVGPLGLGNIAGIVGLFGGGRRRANTPGGYLASAQKYRFDDRNQGCSLTKTESEEYIVWGKPQAPPSHAAPAGNYTATVTLYSHCVESVTEPAIPVPFVLRANIQGQEQIINGTVSTENPTYTLSFPIRR